MDLSSLMIILGSHRYIFLTHKNEALHTFIKHCKKIQNEKGLTLVNVRSDYGGEFENHSFELFYNEHGYDHNFFAFRTPQQNRVIDRKNHFKGNG